MFVQVTSLPKYFHSLNLTEKEDTFLATVSASMHHTLTQFKQGYKSFTSMLSNPYVISSSSTAFPLHSAPE